MLGPQGELADAPEAHDLQRVVAGQKPQQHDHAPRHVHLRPGNLYLESKMLVKTGPASDVGENSL